MWILSLMMSECSLSWRGQGHVSNFCIVDLENFATASRRYTGDTHNSCVVGLFMTHCLQLNLQLHTIGLFRTCCTSSFCTVAWQLARFQLTRRITRSLGDRWASCRDIASYLSKVADFDSPHLHLAPQQGVIPVEFRRVLWHQKTTLPELSYGVVCVILRLAVLVEHRLVTDWRTDTRRKHRPIPRMHSIAR